MKIPGDKAPVLAFSSKLHAPFNASTAVQSTSSVHRRVQTKQGGLSPQGPGQAGSTVTLIFFLNKTFVLFVTDVYKQ